MRLLVIVLLLAGVIIGCIATLRPFLSCLFLGGIFSLATWPAFLWLEENLKLRPLIAASVMATFLALFFLIPLVFLGSSVAQNLDESVHQSTEFFLKHSAAAPAWLKDIPVGGRYADHLWQTYISDKDRMTKTLQEYSIPISQWLIRTGTAIGRGTLDLALAIFMSFFFFCYGQQTSLRIRTLSEKLLGYHGPYLLQVIKRTIIGIIYGMLGTALAQGTLAAIGFTIAGVPQATILGLMTFTLSFVPYAPPLIWIPATLWLLFHGQIGAGIFMGLWGFFAISSIDNVIRPYFISVSSHLPFLLVLLGIFGGMISFGFLGLFLGPTFLALTYTLFREWSAPPKSNALKTENITQPKTVKGD